jgi:hypothetical protein
MFRRNILPPSAGLTMKPSTQIANIVHLGYSLIQKIEAARSSETFLKLPAVYIE